MQQGKVLISFLASGLVAAGCSAVGQESRLGRPDPAPPSKKQAELHCKSRLEVEAVAAARADAGEGDIGKLAEDKARRLAIQQWRVEAAHSYGVDYDRWFTADGKDVTCRHVGDSVRCRVSALPCTGLAAGSSLPKR